MSAVHAEVRAEERAARERERNLERARKAAAKQRRTAAMRRPRRLREVEGRMDELAVELRRVTNAKGRAEIRAELRELGQERMSLRWPG